MKQTVCNSNESLAALQLRIGYHFHDISHLKLALIHKSYANEQQNAANETALIYLNKWLVANNLNEVDMDEALSIGRQVAIY